MHHGSHHRRVRALTFVPLLCLGLCGVGTAAAEESHWSLRGGPVGVFWNESSTVSVAGSKVPGGSVAAKNNASLGVDVGYDLDDRWSLRLAVGVPPTTELTTSGSLNALVPPLSGKLGKVKYGPAVLTAVYRFNPNGRIVPYVGAGASYVYVFDTDDGDVAGLQVDSAWGSVLQAGIDVPLKRGWSLFLDARKILVQTRARGTVPALGGPPASVAVHLDPLIVHTGIEYHF
ncbi:outer membrane beta-barrel protein [Xanthomonas campestris pv. phormiicola]|nr:outer membrane beta-barrel protein [Xanthomonas campestris pv. phormiicola]UYC15827.1 outer membrane beta-barrel protein [Xanthomonas campestris pv. phormiicola]